MKERQYGSAFVARTCATVACRGLIPEFRAKCRPSSASGAPAASGETAAPLSSRRPKKRGPFQGRTGDSSRDDGEAGISRIAPDIALCNDGDGVPLALVFAHLL